jgi:hypothetical protein
MRRGGFVLAVALFVSMAAVALAYPPATVTVTPNSVTLGNLECNTRYEVRVREWRSGAFRDTQTYTPTTSACPVPTPTPTPSPTSTPSPTPTPEPPAQPVASFTVAPNPAIWGQPVTFSSTSTCADSPCSYTWFHGTGTTEQFATGDTATFTYQDTGWPGPANVTLRVTDASGDMDTDTVTFPIEHDATEPTPTPTPDPDPPPSTGFPDASNTGPSGTLTVTTGNLTIGTAGAVVENREIRGCVTVSAQNVTIRNSRIICDGSSAVWAGSSGLVVEDTEIQCANKVGQTGLTPGNYTARRIEASRCENILWAGNNVLVEDSYIHDPIPCCIPGDPHTDSIQTPAGGSNVTIRHSTVYGGYISQSNFGNAAITTAASPGTGATNYIVENNLLAGGGYTIYCPGNVSPTYRLTNNRFSRIYTNTVGGFGPLYHSCGDDNVSGNVYHETGLPVPGG